MSLIVADLASFGPGNEAMAESDSAWLSARWVINPGVYEPV